MNKTELIAALAEKTGSNKKDAEKAINAFVDVVTESLANGDKIQIVGFGSFEVKARPAPHCPQSPHRRGNQDRSLQGSCLQGWQGPQGQRQQVKQMGKCARGTSSPRAFFIVQNRQHAVLYILYQVWIPLVSLVMPTSLCPVAACAKAPSIKVW